MAESHDGSDHDDDFVVVADATLYTASTILDSPNLLHFNWSITERVIENYNECHRLKELNAISPLICHQSSQTRWNLFIDKNLNLCVRLFAMPNNVTSINAHIKCEHSTTGIQYAKSNCIFEKHKAGNHFHILGKINLKNAENIDLFCFIHFAHINYGLSFFFVCFFFAVIF